MRNIFPTEIVSSTVLTFCKGDDCWEGRGLSVLNEVRGWKVVDM